MQERKPATTRQGNRYSLAKGYLKNREAWSGGLWGMGMELLTEC